MWLYKSSINKGDNFLNIIIIIISLYLIFEGVLRVFYKKQDIPYAMWFIKKIFEHSNAWEKSTKWRNFYLSKGIQYSLGVIYLICGCAVLCIIIIYMIR